MKTESRITSHPSGWRIEIDMTDNLPVKQTSVEITKSLLSKYYEYLPYNRLHKESVVNVLHFRETGTCNMAYCQNPARTKPSSSHKRNQYFYTRSLCAAKFVSSVQAHQYPITNVGLATEEIDERLRPRQFEYHPSDPSLMAVGTLDGEVVILNHETGNIIKYISPYQQTSGILGLCWLKKQPSKLLVGSDNDALRLYDINNVTSKLEYGYSIAAVTFDDFEQLTSVHVNSTDDRCLTSGYSKKVAIYDVCTGQRLQLFTDMHREPINVAKFSNHSPNLLATSSFDRDVKMWDLRQDPMRPCYTAASSRGNVMVCFSPDDLYLLVSAVDNEVKQLLAVDGRLHTDFGIVSTGSAYNYTRSYYMNGRDYIISGSCEEPAIRVCCAQTGRRLTDISLEDTGVGSSIFVQSLRSDPFRHFHMAVLAAYSGRKTKNEIIKVNLLSANSRAEEHNVGPNTRRPSYGKGG
ncbi:protein DWD HYPERSENSITIVE TO UV-B 1-like [Primulina eburnea]|uniref:protein DWD HYPERSENSITIVE TO UV-B 1-like n=1 Tax=Primulina eburnea TaxID=1245227 RepID=UPI003C6C3E18